MGLLDLFKKKNSGDVAKDRLKLLLVSDRANCSPEVMEMIKNDIINVISKYMVIDTEALDIQITQTESETNNGSVPALFANIPIKDLKGGRK
ncbi:MAG: cell division topological specificity factor MinE [Butyrivibrio sp.]|nr:cell division topological specificity factor MinE [Butyrivibrio sp.]